MPLAGTLVEGRYRLIRPLGQGASSVVYLAVGTDGTPYAVKLFPPELAGRADREVEVAGNLAHPHLGRVLGRVEAAGQPGVLLSFERGQVMFARYAHRPALREERGAFLQTTRDLLGALAYLHGHGVVHRDVKPENVLVGPSGDAHLVDFDLSGPLNEDFGTPVRIGTAAFQAPEAVRGEPLGPRGDLYAVGVLLYWGLHGELPAHDTPALPSDDPLDRLRAHLTQPAPEDRPASADDVLRDLDALQP